MKTFATLKSTVGKVLKKKQAIGLLFFVALAPIHAAPLDAFLTALPEQMGSQAYLEVGADHMNAQLDFFKIRDSDALAAGTQAGDYHGSHLAGGWRLTDKVWLSGSLLQRNLSGLSTTYSFDSWQLSGLYKLHEAAGKVPALAVRVSAWGNGANEIAATKICAAPVVGNPTQCQTNALLDRVSIAKPTDKDLQVDLIGTWKPTQNVDINALASLGSTQLSFGGLSGMATIDGVSYQLSPVGNDILFTAADGSQRIVKNVYNPSELSWRGNFAQLGVSTTWYHGPWTVRGGYLLYTIQRQTIDDILKSRGWSVVQQNKIVSLEAAYRLRPHMSVFARGQISSALIFNDMPVIYNAFSSDLVGGRYSIYTVGLRADF
jgi:hypothetical protein